MSSDRQNNNDVQQASGDAVPERTPDVTTKEGFSEFVCAKPPARPKKPTKDEFQKMSPAEREQFDEERLRFLNTWEPLDTPCLRSSFETLNLVLRANRYLPPGVPRPGAVLDSYAGGLGKSTILLTVGRHWARQQWAKFPSRRTKSGDEFLPVVYVTLDAGTTVKSLNGLFARFLAIPWSDRSTRNEGTGPVHDVLTRCATSLVLIDDVHFLKMNRQADQLVCEHLKRLASTVPATFVSAGINCLNSGLLWEGLSDSDRSWSQTAGRFARIEVEPFKRMPKEAYEEWVALLKGLEDELILLDSYPGMLSKRLAAYLYDRTHGEIGALMNLIRQGVVLAIVRGTECLTEELLDEVVLAYLQEAESERRGTRKKKVIRFRRRPDDQPPLSAAA